MIFGLFSLLCIVHTYDIFIKSNDINLDDVLTAASRLQGLITNTVLVGETASAIFATHRTSYDANHIVQNLREKFDLILETLESVAGCKTAHIKKSVFILGNLDGI